jgi:hypothetical protein
MKVIIAHSKKYGNHDILVDDSDFEILSKYHWILSKGKTGRYANARIISGIDKKVSMHRMILGLTDPKILCDHKDRNGLNNQRSNLRIATYGQNSQNKGVCRRNEAGFKGVVMNKENKYRKYCAIIIADGKRIFGGGFKTPEEAALKWNELARQYHGEFAYQNQI